jgi:hypothetical protein
MKQYLDEFLNRLEPVSQRTSLVFIVIICIAVLVLAYMQWKDLKRFADLDSDFQDAQQHFVDSLADRVKALNDDFLKNTRQEVDALLGRHGITRDTINDLHAQSADLQSQIKELQNTIKEAADQHVASLNDLVGTSNRYLAAQLQDYQAQLNAQQARLADATS